MKTRINFIIHNLIVHPIMAFLPEEMAYKFHDWHGEKLD